MTEQTLIYGVTFHVKPKKRVHTFWFTERDKALAFYESVKKYAKVIDHNMFQVPVETATEYDGKIEEGRILPVRDVVDDAG